MRSLHTIFENFIKTKHPRDWFQTILPSKPTGGNYFAEKKIRSSDWALQAGKNGYFENKRLAYCYQPYRVCATPLETLQRPVAPFSAINFQLNMKKDRFYQKHFATS